MKAPNQFRVRSGPLGSDDSIGPNGAFDIQLKYGQWVAAITSDQMGWEHVSVSRRGRCPTWEEMCQVKDLFWGPDEVVVQFHPRKEDYVNNHPYCLHMWRPTGGWPQQFTPPVWMVGAK